MDPNPAAPDSRRKPHSLIPPIPSPHAKQASQARSHPLVDLKTLPQQSVHPNPRKDVSTPQHARQPARREKMEHPQGAKS
jgi:hypothetical protein